MSKQDTESPVEPFKRALTSAVRSIAEEPELQVSFGSEPTGVRGDQVRLPLPPRDLPAEEDARIRGAADACSLRLRHHDDNLHRRHAPMGPTATATGLPIAPGPSSSPSTPCTDAVILRGPKCSVPPSISR